MGTPRPAGELAGGEPGRAAEVGKSDGAGSSRSGPRPGGGSAPTATPSRHSMSWNGTPMTAASAQKARLRGASGKTGASAASTFASRAMSDAPWASGPGGGRRNTAGLPSSSTR
jgi:hypothetical protein